MATIDPTPEQLHAHITGQPVQRSMSMYASNADYWKAQAEANAKDAERYRWLRDNTHPDNLRKLFNGCPVAGA